MFLGEIMKINNVLGLAVLAIVCLFSNGCQENVSSDQVRMARLVGNENLQLKKQIQEKDDQINKKDAQIAELTKQLEQSQQTATQAKDKAERVEKNFADTMATYQAQLEECKNALGAAPVPCPELEEKYNALYTSLLEKWTLCETKLEKYEQVEQISPEPANSNPADKK
jgi:phage-related tail protein